MKLHHIQNALVESKYINALEEVSAAFEKEEPEVANLINKSLSLLIKKSNLSLSDLIVLNEEQIKNQIESVTAECKSALLNSYDFERQEIIRKICGRQPKDVFKALAILRSLEQFLNV